MLNVCIKALTEDGAGVATANYHDGVPPLDKPATSCSSWPVNFHSCEGEVIHLLLSGSGGHGIWYDLGCLARGHPGRILYHWSRWKFGWITLAWP